jgi:hypothetical protein
LNVKELITNSRATSFKKCRKRHFWEYEEGIRPETEAKALRIGGAVHAGIDQIKKGGSLEAAHDATGEFYLNPPEGADMWAWEIEQATAMCLVSGWHWRWGDCGGLEIVASEATFRTALRNPATGAPSTKFELAGVQDGIIQVDPRRRMVLEHKTCSEDLSEGSDYWRRLEMDSQISLYTYAARMEGHDVSGVLYDVIRKPTIRPENIPLLDDEGFKIVLDANNERVYTKDGKKPRQTALTADGWVLQTRVMNPHEWAEKLTEDIAQRPEYYYGRREIARLDSELVEAMEEFWDVQKAIADAQNKNAWYRTVSRDTCPYCPFFSLCSSKFAPDMPLPVGFVRVENRHQELGET